jgi:hypothetical protein
LSAQTKGKVTSNGRYRPLREEIRGSTNNPPRGTNAINFLRRFRPEGPWVITCIIPDGYTTTRTFTDLEEARRFIIKRNDQGEGVYYTVNLVTQATQSKPKKADIAEVEYLHLDADPEAGETPEQFKARLQPLLEQAKPTFLIDSGNGLHGLWKLEQPIKTDNPDAVADIEARNLALAEKFGAKAGTQNIDRILRVPGTWNWPNAKKQRDGRAKCWAKRLKHNKVSHPLSAFPPRAAENKSQSASTSAGGGLPANLLTLLHVKDKGGYPSRNELVFAFLTGAIRAGIADAVIIAACLDERFAGNGIFEHIKDNGGLSCAERQLQRAHEKVPSKKVGTAAPAGQKSYELVCAADVVPRPPRWLWRNHLLVGGQELMAGIKGMGKSQIQCSLIACTTNGRIKWPDGERAPEPGNVIMVTTEDALDTVIVPRLIVAGANVKRVFFLKRIKQDNKDRMFLIGEDLDALEQMINEVERTTGDPVSLVTIDPITAVMGKINDRSATDVRGQLGPLKEFAERMDVAFSTITHPPKQPSQRAIDNFVGSSISWDCRHPRR